MEQGIDVAGRLERGEIRLFRFPPPDKHRPVLILTRSSVLDYLSRVTVAPITSTARGVPSELALGIEDGMKDACVVNFHNLMTVPRETLGPRLAQLRAARLREVCEALAFALGCEA
jgi:mRNA interferase MazF